VPSRCENAAVYSSPARDRQINKIVSRNDALESCDNMACAGVLAQNGDTKFGVPKILWLVVVNQADSKLNKASGTAASSTGTRPGCVCKAIIR
jgi:hypothetical protein